MKIKVKRFGVKVYRPFDPVFYSGPFYVWSFEYAPRKLHIGTADTRFKAWKAALKAANKHRKEGAK